MILGIVLVSTTRKEARRLPLNLYGPNWETQITSRSIRLAFSPDGTLLAGLTDDGAVTS